MANVRCLGFAAALALVSAACAETGTVVVHASLPFADTDWSNTLVLPKFDKPLFKLESVGIAFSGAVQGSAQFENRNSVARDYEATIAYSLLLSKPDQTPLLAINPETQTLRGTLAAYDKVLDFGGTSGITYPDVHATAAGTASLTSDTDLAAFIGSGSVSFPVDAASTTSVVASGNFTKIILNQSKADIDVTYTYSFERASVGDRVWVDANGNGLQDAGEKNVGGATVELLDGNGNVVSTTTTSSNGLYKFSGLMPGDYQVRFTAPAGTAFTSTGGGDTALDSDAGNGGLSASFTLHSGENRTDIDAGIVGLQSVGDFVWLDSNANGVQDAGEPGLAGVGVTLLDNSGNVIGTTTTDGNGIYGFTGLIPGDYKIKFDDVSSYLRSPTLAGGNTDKDSNAGTDGTTATFTLNPGDHRTDIDAGYYGTFNLGDRVWFDANANGKQDDGERGIPGVTVTLLDGNGNVIGTPLVTDSNGNYLFTNLLPANYKVKFTKPAGYTFTGAHVGTDVSIDSDADGSGISDVIALTADNLNIDAGLYGGLCLGDRVWKDLDRDGLQDSCEPGVPGVAVHLLDKDGNVIADTVTDANGYYRFTNLAPGDYTVDFDAPAGYGFTKQFADSRYKQYDSNVDPLTGLATVTLSTNDSTIDAGLIGAQKIGDTVWLDSDGDGKYEPEVGEKGIKGVRVTLIGDTNNDGRVDVTLSTVTDADGHYKFIGLNPGTYQVSVNANDLPYGVKQTYDLDGLGSKNVATAKLIAGTDNLDFDFGYKPGSTCGTGSHSWWGCNPNKWNCDKVWVGGKCHTKTTVCNWFSKSDCGDKSICVYQRLCAAKLNVGNGCNEGVTYTCGKTTCTVKEAIKRCDDWMSRNPVGCKVSGNSSNWASIADCYAILDKYCSGR